MGLISDEGGIFEIMAGLYSGGKANIDVFLQSHAGHGIRVDRGSRATFLDKPALSFGLAVQPEILSGFGNKGKSHFRGVGALARFMYCFPVSNIGDRDVGKRIPIPEDIKRRYRDGIFDLLRIQPVLDETGTEVPRVIHVNEEALDIWKQFSQYIESRQGERREFESIQDWTGKLPGAALRIAGLCNVAINIDQNTEINKAEMTRVLDFCESLIPHTQKAFNSMGADQTIADANIVLRWIKDKGELHFKRGDCQRDHHGRFLKVDRLLKALDVLIGWNVISEVSPAKTGTPGRPALVYHVNPAVLLGGKL